MIFLVRLLWFVSAVSAGLGQKTNLGRDLRRITIS